MNRLQIVLAIGFLFSLTQANFAEDPPKKDPRKKGPPTIKALMITGGGYHDYKNQKKILSEGIGKRINIEWTIVLENPKRGALPDVYKKDTWADGFDVIVHNECFASYSDAKQIEKIVKAHTDKGLGSVMIHCAMHTFRNTKSKAWDNLVGVESRRHGPHFPFIVKNLETKDPIMKGFPKRWKTPKGELYHTKIIKSATALGLGFKEGNEEKTKQVCIWKNEFNKARTFGTTIGHYNEAMKEKVYLDLVTRGLLWSIKKLDKDGKPLKGYEKTAKKPTSTRFRVVHENGDVWEFADASALIKSGIYLGENNCKCPCEENAK